MHNLPGVMSAPGCTVGRRQADWLWTLSVAPHIALDVLEQLMAGPTLAALPCNLQDMLPRICC